MRFFGNFLLTILFIPLFLIAILGISVKFQLLEPNFWQTTFRTNNVYVKLADTVKNIAEMQTVKGGGSRGEARVLTSLVTPANLQDFLEKNFQNIFNFANGKATAAVIYVPVSKLPRGLIPKQISETTPLATFLNEFNVHGVSDTQIKNLSHFGAWTSNILIFDLTFLVVILVCFFLLAGKEKRLMAPGVAFILAGLLTLALASFGNMLRGSMLTDWVKSQEPVQLLLSPFLPYILQEVTKIWFYIGGFALSAGIVLLFIKKR